MEWVEFTARTLEEAKDLALIGWVSPPMTPSSRCSPSPSPACSAACRGEARVRARVRPAQARQKVERRERRPRKSEGGEAATRRKPKLPRHRAARPAVPGRAVDGAGADDAAVKPPEADRGSNRT